MMQTMLVTLCKIPSNVGRIFKSQISRVLKNGDKMLGKLANFNKM